MTNINAFIKDWQSHRKVLQAMLDVVTTEQLSYRPWEKGMSVSELALHIAGAMNMFVSTVKNGAYTPGQKATPPSTIEELKAKIAADTEQSEAILTSITPEQLEQSIDFFGHPITGAVLLQNAKDHEIHHKGQMFVYLRMAGIENLPFFVSR
ncbi:DinB family protein [Cohnella yongneupensis]|uniref:DinB family protein n=1 Tax=Cohnella yongneupensis TaxID=425006 RepID=A0ABW0R002_9BACL